MFQPDETAIDLFRRTNDKEIFHFSMSATRADEEFCFRDMAEIIAFDYQIPEVIINR